MEFRLFQLENYKSSLMLELEKIKLDILVAKDDGDLEEWEELKKRRKLIRTKVEDLEKKIEELITESKNEVSES